MYKVMPGIKVYPSSKQLARRMSLTLAEERREIAKRVSPDLMV
jgi:hypothetical protein